jgi:hypothetical protein
MRLSILAILLLSGCLGPIRFRATIEAWHKGQYVRCEEIVDEAGINKPICQISEEMNIKSRPRAVSPECADIEFLVKRWRDGKEKLIAVPRLILDGLKPVSVTTEKGNKKIIVKAERLP